MKWEECDEKIRRSGYESYCEYICYKFGDKAKVLTYEEWCRETEAYGELLDVDI